jgi:hypothetical protein
MPADVSPRSTRRRWIVRAFWTLLAAAVAGAAGSFVGAGAALLIAVSAILLAIAVARRRIYATLRGAAIGAGFLVIVGPLADWLLFGRPLTARLPAALVAGTLVGAAYGLARSRRSADAQAKPIDPQAGVRQ